MRAVSQLGIHICAALTVVMWGISFVSTTYIMDAGIGPVTVYVARFVLAYLLMWIVSHKQLWAFSLRDELLLIVCGLCGSTVYYLAENFALQYTLATNVSLITSMAPLLTLLLCGAIYKGEHPSRGALIGSFVAFSGVGFVIFNSSFVMKINPLGDLLSLAAALCWAIYSLVLRKLNALYDVAFVTRKTFFYGLITSAPFIIFSGEEVFSPAWGEGAVLGNFLFLTIGCTFAAFLIWGWAVKRLGAIKASNYIYFQPVITLIFSVIFLGQSLTAVGITGCVLILSGVILCDKLNLRAKMRA